MQKDAGSLKGPGFTGAYLTFRQVFEETGLLDVGHLPSAGANLQFKAHRGGRVLQVVRGLALSGRKWGIPQV